MTAVNVPIPAEALMTSPSVPFGLSGAPNGMVKPTTTPLGEMEASCGGCTNIIDQESGGVVVAFGSSLWHVDCFRCAKCKDRVSADTNLLLLSDGSPVCGNCSYQCFVCKQAITEEAIMTGDESYHAHCFTCRTCKRRIEELVFAKTSQGIYCMACHNERVAKSRRHAEAKRQRAARKEREKEEERRRDEGFRLQSSPVAPSASGNNLLSSPAPNGSSSPGTSPQATPNSFNSGNFTDNTSPQVGGTPVASDEEGRHKDQAVDESMSMPRASSAMSNRSAENLPLPASPSESVMTARPKAIDPVDRGSNSPRNGSPSSSAFPSAANSMSTLSTSASSRGLTIGLGVGPIERSYGGSGLDVPTSRADKRRSINPAMTFNMDAQNSTFAVEPRLAPLPPSPLRASFTDLHMEVPMRSPTSPTPAYSGGDGFPFKSGSTSQLSPPLTSADGPSSAPPPRTTSLADHIATSRSRGGLNSASEESSPENVTAPLVIPPRTPVHVAEATGTTPRLHAPDLPPMSFSLSDPDFALILSNIDRSPKRAGERTPVDGVHPTIEVEDSPPASPLGGGIIRSPAQVDILAAAKEETPNLRSRSRSRSPSRSRLSPNGSTPQLLRTRQPSAESTHSVTSRLGADSAFASIVEAVAGAKHAGEQTVSVDLSVLVGIVAEVEELKEFTTGLKSKYTGAKRTSQQYSEGLTVAGEEYDKEVALRRELEAEVTRLRAQVHAQTARLSVISGDERRAETMRRRSHDLASSLTGLEKDISKLRAQRDMALAEVESLNTARQSIDAKAVEGSAEADAAADLGHALTSRLDTIREQYREELEPLTAQREALQREIADLRETREQFLEESTALAAKNDELVELNSQLSRQAETMQDAIARARTPTIFSKRGHPSGSPSLSSLSASATLQEVPEETARVVKVTKPEPIEAAPARRFKWYKSSKGPDLSTTSASISRPLAIPPDRNKMQRPSTEFGLKEHNFTQHSTMRFTRCEVCSEKMWGLQEVRCASCGIVCHSKCSEKLPKSCTGSRNGQAEVIEGPLPPSMFGKELGEQVTSDKSQVPMIVTKCISAVEAVGMEYEGIYRKTGGSSQSKQITQLFERGDYDAFDLADVESFNDISSVTSVLKTYFRQLPNPLLTHALHESFVAAASIRDTGNKHTALCALLKELPKDHYNTLRALMLHLNRVTGHSGVNLMTSQNLGVVFGPTLMRSADPNREFGDMAGKALSIQWMVDNAPQVFAEAR